MDQGTLPNMSVVAPMHANSAKGTGQGIQGQVVAGEPVMNPQLNDPLMQQKEYETKVFPIKEAQSATLPKQAKSMQMKVSTGNSAFDEEFS